jgi:hypothetical protein
MVDITIRKGVEAELYEIHKELMELNENLSNKTLVYKVTDYILKNYLVGTIHMDEKNAQFIIVPKKTTSLN